MNERLKKYFSWRIKTILKRNLRITNKTFNIITPTYNYAKRNVLLHRAIDSIIRQSTHTLHVNHLIYFDGEAPKTLANLGMEVPAWYSQKRIAVANCERYSTDLRNAGLHEVQRGWVMILSDHNELLPGAFSALEKQLSASAGTIQFRVRRRCDDQSIPLDVDNPSISDSSSLALIVNADVAWLVDYQHRILRDFQYEENIRAMSAHYGFKNLVSDDIIGIDVDAIDVGSSLGVSDG